MKKARGFIQLGSFKQISTIIVIIGVIISIILGSYQISQEILKAKEIQKEVQIQLSIGDIFSERQKYSMAIKEYEKALSFDNDNIEVHRRIIITSRKKFELQLTEDPYKLESQEVDDTLTRLYRVYSLNPSLKEDIGLLLEEALILKADRRLKTSIFVLEKAYNLSPENPDVLAELGLLTSSKENIEALDLIRRAIEIQPDNPLYHYYLANRAENAALYAEAIREYNRTTSLAFDEPQIIVVLRPCSMRAFDSERLSSYSFHLRHIFLENGLNNESLLNSELDMPLLERAHVLEYYREKGEFYDDSYCYLARTYYELGDLEKATATIRSGLEESKTYKNTPKLLIIYAMFLEESNLEPTTLKEVYAKLGNYSYQRYCFELILWNHAHDYFTKNFTEGPKNNIILKSRIQDVATNL